MTKLSLLLFMAFMLFVFSCGNPELERLEAKSKESNCKAEWSKHWLENSGNTTALGVQKGFSKELDDFNKLINDSTIICDSLKYKWNELSDKILNAK
jgi:hypothetical protein